MFKGKARVAFPNSNNGKLCCTRSCNPKHILRAAGHRAKKYFRCLFSRQTSFAKLRGQSVTETGNNRCSFSDTLILEAAIVCVLFIGKGKDSWSKSTSNSGPDCRLLVAGRSSEKNQLASWFVLWKSSFQRKLKCARTFYRTYRTYRTTVDEASSTVNRVVQNVTLIPFANII